jgi:hypothetical protein
MHHAPAAIMQPTTSVEPPQQRARDAGTDVDRCTRCKKPLCEKARERRFGGWQVLCLDCALEDLPGTD